MKILYLVRHAKSSWKDASLSDGERPLKNRGKQDAIAMAKRLSKMMISPDLMISSPAKRALKTATIFSNILMPTSGSAIRIENNLYLASAEEYLNIIRQIDRQYDCVMIFGHNPGISETASLLSTGFYENMGTCSVIGLSFEKTRWAAIKPGDAHKLFTKNRKNLD